MKSSKKRKIVHGFYQDGFNWEESDEFICPHCKGRFIVEWVDLKHIPTIDKCPYCKKELELIRSFVGENDNIIYGAPRPGFNWANEDTFMCPNCNKIFYVNWSKLPCSIKCPKCRKKYHLKPSVEG